MKHFPNTPLGKATEALYRLTLAPVEEDSEQQDREYRELCENAVLCIAAYMDSERIKLSVGDFK